MERDGMADDGIEGDCIEGDGIEGTNEGDGIEGEGENSVLPLVTKYPLAPKRLQAGGGCKKPQGEPGAWTFPGVAQPLAATNCCCWSHR